jgi:hypothetical protein
VGALNLQIEKPLYEEFMTKFQEPFSLLDDIEILDELERLISQIVPISPIIFRSNHASNVYSLGGTLPLESNKLIETINRLKSNPSLLKPKVLRRF